MQNASILPSVPIAIEGYPKILIITVVVDTVVQVVVDVVLLLLLLLQLVHVQLEEKLQMQQDLTDEPFVVYRMDMLVHHYFWMFQQLSLIHISEPTRLV